MQSGWLIYITCETFGLVSYHGSKWDGS